METSNRKSFKMATIVGIAAFTGFLLIFPLMLFTSGPSYLGFVLLYLFYSLMMKGQIFIGLGLAFLIGLISFLVFRFLIKSDISKEILGWVLFFISGIALVAGFFIFLRVDEFITRRGKEARERKNTQQLDTNNDGKIDEWVRIYEASSRKSVEKDTNFDGKVDLIEFYDSRGSLEYKYIDTNNDGKMDIDETYNNNKLTRRRIIDVNTRKETIENFK